MLKYKYKYILCSGTLLGYARYRNILRWDDDIDIFIPPENQYDDPI